MENTLGKYAPQIYALLRIVAGLLFAMHGTQKLFAWPGDKEAVELVSIMGLAGIIECFGGLMIAFGFMAGWAAFLASGQMAVAYFWKHAPQDLFPIVNKGELAVLYCFVFLYIAATGSGIWSVDALRGKNKRI